MPSTTRHAGTGRGTCRIARSMIPETLAETSVTAHTHAFGLSDGPGKVPINAATSTTDALSSRGRYWESPRASGADPSLPDRAWLVVNVDSPVAITHRGERPSDKVVTNSGVHETFLPCTSTSSGAGSALVAVAWAGAFTRAFGPRPTRSVRLGGRLECELTRNRAPP